MALTYTIEALDGGMEVRLSRAHEVRCRVWMCHEVAERFLQSITQGVEEALRRQSREEYDVVLSRLLALMRAVLAGKPGGSIEVPEDAGRLLPFLN